MMEDTKFAPIYKRIEEDLRAQIQSGRWGPGAMIPGRRELAEVYGVTPPTMMKAIRGLVADGILKTHGSRGTFVNASGRVASGTDKLVRSIAPAAAERPRPTTDDPSGYGRRPGMVGIIARYDSPADFWTRTILQHIEQDLQDAGIPSRFVNVNSSLAEDELLLPEAVERLRAENVDALVIILYHDHGPMERQFDEKVWHALSDLLSDMTIPVALVSTRRLNFLPVQVFAHIHYDHQFCGFRAAQHLIEQGHRQITILAPFAIPWLDERIAGAQEAVRQMGLPAAALDIYRWRQEDEYDWAFHDERGLACGRDLLGNRSCPRAVIAPNDLVARGFLMAAEERGFRAGVDYAIIGCDDDDFASALGLTTLRPPLKMMADETAALLIENRYQGRAFVQVNLHPTLIARASTR